MHHVQIRDMAAVVTRRLFVTSQNPAYDTMPPPSQAVFRKYVHNAMFITYSELLEMLRHETERSLRKNITSIVSELGGNLIAESQNQAQGQQQQLQWLVILNHKNSIYFDGILRFYCCAGVVFEVGTCRVVLLIASDIQA